MFEQQTILTTQNSQKLNEITDEPRWQTCGQMMAAHFAKQPDRILLLDIDGVVLRGDSLYKPRLMNPYIIPALARLENLGVRIGPATARGQHILEFLRQDHKLRMLGPAILEEGQVCIENGDVHFLAKPEHRYFHLEVLNRLSQQFEFRSEWNSVKSDAEKNIFSFCRGNYQWQGTFRSSYWFEYKGNPNLGLEKDQEIVDQIFEPQIKEAAQKYGLDYDRDISVKVNRMSVGGLVIVRIAALNDGKPINKGMAAEKFLQGHSPWVLAADGFGDDSLRRLTQDVMKGMVVGIGGNLDISLEVPMFMKRADAMIGEPLQFALALEYCADILAGH